MTMDERVEAATAAIRKFLGDAAMSPTAEYIARIALQAGVPELQGDKPKGWIAPWEATESMYEGALEFALQRMEAAGVDGLSPWKDYPPIRGTTEGMFAAMRDVYLGKGGGG